MSYQSASDPKTPSQRLAELAGLGDEAAQEAVAQNPNASAGTLASLVALDRRYASLVLQNPALSLFLFGSNGLPEEFVEPPLAACRLLREPEAPLSLLYWASGHDNARLRRSVARNPKTPSELLLLLQNDPDDWVRLAVAQHPNTPEEAFYKLLTDLDWHVSRSAMQHPNAARLVELLGPAWQNFFQERLPLEGHQTSNGVSFRLENVIQEHIEANPITPSLQKIFLRGGAIALWALLYDPEVTPETLCAIALRAQKERNVHTRELWCRLVGRPKTPIEVCRRLIEAEIARGPLDSVHVGTALQNHLLPEDVRGMLLARCDSLARLASDRRTPLWVLERLSQSEDPGVLRNLASNPVFPDEQRACLSVLRSLETLRHMAGFLHNERRLYWIARQVGYPGSEPCSDLPEAGQWNEEEALEIKMNLSQNISASDPLLRWLATFPELREYLLMNEALPEDLVLSLLEDAPQDVINSAVFSQALPMEWWEKVFSEPNPELRSLLLEHSLPQSILDRLASDPSPKARWRVALQSSNPETLEKFLEDPALRQIIANNQNISESLVRTLASYQDFEIHKGLASNQNTPADLLVEIAKEADVDTKHSLALRENLPWHAFWEYEVDLDLEPVDWFYV